MTQFELDRFNVDWLMKHTEDAYMRGMYGDAAWKSIIKFLHGWGFTVAEIELILKSKHMRWANDYSDRLTRAGFAKYFNDHPQYFTQEALYHLWPGRKGVR